MTKQRAIHIEMHGQVLTLTPAGNGWSMGELFVWKANYLRNNPWRATWTDLFGVRHAIERSTLTALKLAMKKGAMR